MYVNVALSSTVLPPLAGSLMERVKINIVDDEDCQHPQPWIHEVDASLTTAVEESIHGDLPKTRKLWLSMAQPTAVKAIIRHSVIKGLRPEGVGVICINGNRGSCAGIICEAHGSQMLQGVGGVV